ncbi:hypothetical protein [Nocardioides sp. cx-173]|uniref:hypothetical protein n=1 Tax=Nocardioides sp. cx-173 TaxID=2898796 RepID=UPI001E48AC09|nr:hypothetical protein [Nocardioides sp. cx-173]MCD4524097.1 hypothetical protein [Nocardioides sp. cx-173]UGB41494.1 hypothetical protein LQ940_19290 [Nocardioides sp. cx-173]
MTASPRTARPFVVGSLVGLVILALLVAFAVLLPKATAGPVDLPDTLPGGLRAVELEADDVTGENADAAADLAERQRGINESGAELLEELFDAPAQIRTYQDESLETQVTITVVEQPAGPFLPNGPPFDPSYVNFERNITDLVSAGDGVCARYYEQPVPEGQEIPDGESPAAIQCQVGSGNATYQLYGRGLDADEAVELLDGLAD